jgi:catechol 2,3-dioxygenase-like lactoylglutathione lyase family enzyme
MLRSRKRTRARITGPESDAAASPARQNRTRYMQSAITDLFAGVPVSDLDASIDWYTRFFGRPADGRVGDEVIWEIQKHATLFIEPNAAQAGAGRITFAVAGLDALLERLAAQRIEHEPIETYSNGVGHVKVPDPDGNALALAEQSDALLPASA